MTDWGFDVDWSLGQRVNLSRLRREAPRFFKQQSTIGLLTTLQSHWNDHMRHQLMHKQFLVPILKKEAA